MIRTLLYTVAAVDVVEGDYVDILGIVQGEVVRVEDLTDEVVLHIKDEEEFCEVVKHVVDPFEEIDILGY